MSDSEKINLHRRLQCGPQPIVRKNRPRCFHEAAEPHANWWYVSLHDQMATAPTWAEAFEIALAMHRRSRERDW